MGREMLADDIGMGANDIRAREIVDAIFRNIRNRKFLSYLFEEDPSNVGAWGHLNTPFDLAVQRDIYDAWTKIVRSRLP